MKKFVCLMLTSWLAAYSSSSNAQTTWGGFVSAGYVHPTANNFYGYNSGDHGPVLEAGLHGYWYLNQYFSLSGLVIARSNGDWFNQGLEVDYLNLKTQFYSSDSWQFDAKWGRFKLINGIYGATRDVPFTKPSIILPQSVYPNLLREQSLRADGVSFDLEYLSAGGGSYGFNASVGKEPFDDSFTRRFFGQDQGGTFESDWNTTFNLILEPNPEWLIQLHYRKLKTNLKDSIVIQTPLDGIPVDFFLNTDQYIASLQYNLQYVQLTSEFTVRKGGTYGTSSHPAGSLVAPAFDGSTDMRAYYLQAIVFAHRELDILVRYDDIHFLDSDIDPGLRDLKDIALGLTWNFHKNAQVRLEHHWFDGVSMIPPINDLNPLRENNPEQNWRMFAAEFNFRF